MTRMRKRFLDCSGLSMEECESFARGLAEQQRDVMFQLGDLYRYAETRWPNSHVQIWPEWVSPGMLQRAAGVCRAYPSEDDRAIDATYTQYMQKAGQRDRQELLEATVDKGLTSDESRKAETRWLLAIDCNYFLHRFWFSGAGVEAASGVASWLERTVERLQPKGLTDVACCFDDRVNHRKEFTKEWDDKYKDRPAKDPELSQQLGTVRELLEAKGFACISFEGMEGDDVMASFAKQFAGNVTLMTQDKDCRQCLSDKCNMLLDVEWKTNGICIECGASLGQVSVGLDVHCPACDEINSPTGETFPVYRWLSAKQHTEATGIPPHLWVEFQTLMGDAVDGIKGAVGIGEKGAADLVKEFGTVESCIQAAKDGDERIKPKRIESLIAFESKAETTRRLVTLVDDLPIPRTTRIAADAIEAS